MADRSSPRSPSRTLCSVLARARAPPRACSSPRHATNLAPFGTRDDVGTKSAPRRGRTARGRSVSVKRGWMAASDKKTDEVQHFLSDHNHRWPRWTKRCRFGFAACSHDVLRRPLACVCVRAWPIVFVVLRRAVRRLSVSACGYGSLLVYAR